MRVWGCLAYVKLPDRQLSALGPRSVAGMFIGYETGSKAYRVLVQGKVMVSKDVRVIENELGDPVVTPPSPQPEMGVEGLFHDEEEVSDESLERAIDTPREIAADPELRAGNLHEVMRRAHEVLQQLLAEPPAAEVLMRKFMMRGVGMMRAEGRLVREMRNSMRKKVKRGEEVVGVTI